MTNNAIGYTTLKTTREEARAALVAIVCLFCGHAPQIKKTKKKKRKKKRKERKMRTRHSGARETKKDRASWKNLFQRDSTFWMARSLDGYGNGIKCYSKQFYGQYFSPRNLLFMVIHRVRGRLTSLPWLRPQLWKNSKIPTERFKHLKFLLDAQVKFRSG